MHIVQKGTYNFTVSLLASRVVILPNFFFYPQREEGMIQGQLNNSDSSQYIRELKDQIDELKAEVSPS